MLQEHFYVWYSLLTSSGQQANNAVRAMQFKSQDTWHDYAIAVADTSLQEAQFIATSS